LRGGAGGQCVAGSLDFEKCHKAKQVPLSMKCTNPWPLNFLNHHCFALNSGVSCRSRYQRNSTVGNSTPVSQGKHFAKNQPGHQLASFKIVVFLIFAQNLWRQNRAEMCRFGEHSPGPHRPFPPWAASRCFEAHRVLFCIMLLR